MKLALMLKVSVSAQQVDRLLARFASERGHTSSHYTLVEGGVESSDVLRVTDGRKEIKVSLCGIDAPDEGQALESAAQEHLRRLMAKGPGRGHASRD